MLSIYVTAEGLERVALGKFLYAWDFSVREEGGLPPERGAKIGEIEPKYPSIAECIPVVMETLKAKEAEIQAEAYGEVQKIQERRNNLLILENQA